MPFLSGKLFSGKRSPGSPPARGAIGSAAVLALLLLATAPPGAWAEGAPAVKDWMPPDLSADEQREWKSGLPPGWRRAPSGETRPCPTGSTSCTGRARPAPAGEKDAVERLRQWARQRGVQPAVVDSAVVGLEGAARRGVPVETAERLVRTAAERGVSPRGIEVITRALAYGAERGALLANLESFARESLNAGAAPDAIALGIYRLAAPARP